MVNANELRIGNKILNVDGDIVTVTELRDDFYLGDGRGLYYHTSSGIILSSEILEKCGAEIYDEENKRYLLEGYYYYDNCLWFGTSQIEVIYLHDLQNLIFALFRKELNYTP